MSFTACAISQRRFYCTTQSFFLGQACNNVGTVVFIGSCFSTTRRWSRLLLLLLHDYAQNLLQLLVLQVSFAFLSPSVHVVVLLQKFLDGHQRDNASGRRCFAKGEPNGIVVL